MGKCSVCGKLSNNTNVTLHKFPRDEVLCKQWVKGIDREGWMPTNSSFICSDHFSEDRFLVYYNRKRLKPGSVPTILPKKSRCEPPKSNGRNNNDVLATSATIEEVPEPIIVVECNHSPTTSNQTLSKDFSSPCTSKTADVRENCQLVTLHDNILHDHRYHNTPRSTMKKFNNMRSRLESTMKENRLLKQQVTRLKKKVHSLQDVIQGLQENRLLPDSAYYCLSANADISLELFNRMIKNQKNMGKLTRDKYPPALRAFALTVHFYSPKAYSYIRETFNLALPHADVLRTWYSCVDAEPGFTEESFASLKEKSDELKEKGQRLLCAVIFDEMGIKKGCQRGRDGTMRGHVDLGVGISGGDDLPEAKHALVIMVVPLDKNWKLPIGYFLITTLNSETKANLLREAFIRLQKAGVTVCSLTLDGPCDHFAAVERLGARMHVDPKKAGHENINNIFKVHFAHPVPGEPDVNVIFDACHMLKNIRNCLGEYLVLFDGEGNKIEWRYVQALALLQQKEGLRLGNRLRTKHIEYRKMVMKVALAAQTLSSSVADSIEFCWNVLKIGEFEGGAATARFLRCADTLFDFLNVRNPLGKHLKCPLKRENEDIWRARLIVELEYLSKIKDKNGTSIFLSRRKAGFIGLFTAVLSTFNIYDLYVKPNESQIKYLLTYKMSQDHLELFFALLEAEVGGAQIQQFRSLFPRTSDCLYDMTFQLIQET